MVFDTTSNVKKVAGQIQGGEREKSKEISGEMVVDRVEHCYFSLATRASQQPRGFSKGAVALPCALAFRDLKGGSHKEGGGENHSGSDNDDSWYCFKERVKMSMNEAWRGIKENALIT